MDIEEIKKEIHKLESDKSSWANCEKLAALYTVIDHNSTAKAYEPAVDYSSKSIRSLQPTEFREAVLSTGNMESALTILDEHMDAVKDVFPKEYRAVIHRLKEINN